MSSSIDFQTVKNGKTYTIDGYKYEGKVSKGRKMLQRNILTGSDTVNKTIRGWKRDFERNFYDIQFITDYGSTIEIKGHFCYPSESYYLTTGATSNRWDVYEQNKKPRPC